MTRLGPPAGKATRGNTSSTIGAGYSYVNTAPVDTASLPVPPDAVSTTTGPIRPPSDEAEVWQTRRFTGGDVRRRGRRAAGNTGDTDGRHVARIAPQVAARDGKYGTAEE